MDNQSVENAIPNQSVTAVAPGSWAYVRRGQPNEEVVEAMENKNTHRLSSITSYDDARQVFVRSYLASNGCILRLLRRRGAEPICGNCAKSATEVSAVKWKNVGKVGFSFPSMFHQFHRFFHSPSFVNLRTYKAYSFLPFSKVTLSAKS